MTGRNKLECTFCQFNPLMNLECCVTCSARRSDFTVPCRTLWIFDNILSIELRISGKEIVSLFTLSRIYEPSRQAKLETASHIKWFGFHFSCLQCPHTGVLFRVVLPGGGRVFTLSNADPSFSQCTRLI